MLERMHVDTEDWGLFRMMARIAEIEARFGSPFQEARAMGFQAQLEAASQAQQAAGLSTMDNLLAAQPIGESDELLGDLSAGGKALISANNAPGRGYGDPSKYEELIGEAASKHNLPGDLIKAVMAQESNFDPTAISHAGAQGLMQLMPETADYLGVLDAFNPKENIEGGAKYLKEQLDRFGSLDKALAAYNAGPEKVEEFGGVPPFKETQDYVVNVKRLLKRYQSE